MFGNFNITLNVPKEFPSDNCLQELVFTLRTFVGKVFSEITSDWCISFLETPPITLPHLNDLESFLPIFILRASRLVPFSLVPSPYLHHSERVVFLDNDNSDKNIPWLQKPCCNDCKLRLL